MAKVSDVSGSSQQIGKQLSQVLLAQGLKEAQVEQRVPVSRTRSSSTSSAPARSPRPGRCATSTRR